MLHNAFNSETQHTWQCTRQVFVFWTTDDLTEPSPGHLKIIKGKELVEKVIDNNFKSDSGGEMEMLNMNRIPGWYKRKQHIRSNMMFHPFIQKLCMKTEFPFMRPCNLTPNCSRKGKNKNKKNPTTNNKPHTQQLSRLTWSVDTQTVAFFPSGPHSLYHYSHYSKAKNTVRS